MKYHHADAINTLPILGLFIAKAADEIGWGKLIVGALLTFILTGIAWNLNSIATDIRELRNVSVNNRQSTIMEQAAINARLERFDANQKTVMQRNDEQDRKINSLEDCFKIKPMTR